MKPPGFSKAWPEKPRSVSLWPGLAGLKACRLSAGRPGRLRTLPRNSYFIIGVKGSEVHFGSMHLPESNTVIPVWGSEGSGARRDRYPEVRNGEGGMLGREWLWLMIEGRIGG